MVRGKEDLPCRPSVPARQSAQVKSLPLEGDNQLKDDRETTSATD